MPPKGVRGGRITRDHVIRNAAHFRGSGSATWSTNDEIAVLVTWKQRARSSNPDVAERARKALRGYPKTFYARTKANAWGKVEPKDVAEFLGIPWPPDETLDLDALTIEY